MFHTKIHIISQACPRLSTSLQSSIMTWKYLILVFWQVFSGPGRGDFGQPVRVQQGGGLRSPGGGAALPLGEIRHAAVPGWRRRGHEVRNVFLFICFFVHFSFILFIYSLLFIFVYLFYLFVCIFIDCVLFVFTYLFCLWYLFIILFILIFGYFVIFYLLLIYFINLFIVNLVYDFI